MGVFRKRSKGFGSTSNKGSETRLSHVHQDCKEEHNPVIMVADVDFSIVGIVDYRSCCHPQRCIRDALPSRRRKTHVSKCPLEHARLQCGAWLSARQEGRSEVRLPGCLCHGLGRNTSREDDPPTWSQHAKAKAAKVPSWDTNHRVICTRKILQLSQHCGSRVIPETPNTRPETLIQQTLYKPSIKPSMNPNNPPVNPP